MVEHVHQFGGHDQDVVVREVVALFGVAEFVRRAW